MLTLFTLCHSLDRKQIASTFYYQLINTTFNFSTLFLLASIVNLALRATENSSVQTSSLSHLVGLPVFWHDAYDNPTMEWDKWVDLFQIAKMAKKFKIHHGAHTSGDRADSQGSRSYWGFGRRPCKQEIC